MRKSALSKSLALTFLIPLLFDGYGRFPERKLRRIPLLKEGDPKPRDPEEKMRKKKIT